MGNSPRHQRSIPHYSRSLRWIIVLVYTIHEHSKNKQDNTFSQDLFIFISGLFVFISRHFAMKTITWMKKMKILRWKQQYWDRIIGYCPVSRDSEPIKLRHLMKVMCSILYTNVAYAELCERSVAPNSIPSFQIKITLSLLKTLTLSESALSNANN